MPEISFSHPQVNGGAPLVVSTGADMIRWSYALNTQNFPTYGGEVVQILSVAVEDVTIQGTVRTYRQMERIYKYFLSFVQIASQGRGTDPAHGSTAYNQQPMLMQYPERDWSMKIIPRNLPEFTKGLEVVAPQWRVQAYVVDDSQDVEELKNLVLEGVQLHGEEFELTAEVGYSAKNPFSDPFPDPDKKDAEFDPTSTREQWREAGDYFNEIIPSWLEGDFESITAQFGAKPAFLNEGNAGQPTGGGGDPERADDGSNKGPEQVR